MNDDLLRLIRWLRRARPSRGALVRALASGFVASGFNAALVVGAVALLVASATRPGLHAVLGPLIVIELFAFLRSPLRFQERISAHRLGYAAVTHWRRWLVVNISCLDYSRWRQYASGDLLERALRDTDELQDLWLRCVVPLTTTTLIMLLGDAVIALFPPHGHWWPLALALLGVQICGGLALCANLGPLLARDRVVREARGNYQAELVELGAVAPDLALLGRGSYAFTRSVRVVEPLRHAERSLRRRRQVSSLIVPTAALAALSITVLRPVTSPLWIVVAALVAFSTFEQLGAVRFALDAAVAVNAGAQRLESFDEVRETGHASWPTDATLRLDDVTISEDGVVLVNAASLEIIPGRRVALVGASGVGKSTLLRSLAMLDQTQSGTILVGDVAVGELDEPTFREHVAYVTSEPGLTRGFAIDVVRMGRPTSRDLFADLAALGIVAEAGTRWEDLSRGEAERVAIVRALVTRPSVLLLDEPTAGLGYTETANLLDLIASSGATVVVATHDDQVRSWCDDVVELRDAALVTLNR